MGRERARSITIERIRGRLKGNATRRKRRFNLGYMNDGRCEALRRHGCTKGVGMDCILSGAFSQGWCWLVDCASLRPTAWMFDGVSRRIGSAGRFSLSLSSLYLSPSRRPILLAITSLVDQIKGLGAAREPTQRGLGKGWGFKVTDRLQEVGGAQNRDSFPRGGWSS